MRTPAEYVTYKISYYRALWHLFQAKRWLRKAGETGERLKAFIARAKAEGVSTLSLEQARRRLLATIDRVEKTTSGATSMPSLLDRLDRFNAEAEAVLKGTDRKFDA